MEQKTVCLASDISYLCGVYFAHWVYSYFLQKKKIQELPDIDKIFLDENFLVRFKNKSRKRQENIKEQLRTDQT